MARIMRLNKKRLRNNTTIFTLAPSVFLSLLSSLLCGCDGRKKLVKKHHLHTFQLSVQTRTGPALILPVKGEAGFHLAYAQCNCHSAAAAETLVGEVGGTEEQRPEFLSAQLLPMVSLPWNYSRAAISLQQGAMEREKKASNVISSRL